MAEPSELSEVRKSIELELPVVAIKDNEEAWMNSLIREIDYLILHNFDKLVSILYRLDISESKIREVFKNTQLNTSVHAGEIISKLIVERQLQKLKTKREHSKDQPPGTDKMERW